MTENVARLRALEESGDHPALISALEAAVRADRHALADPWVKEWCGRRWRNIFVSEAIHDPAALKAARRRLGLPGSDKRGDRQRIAERFLRDQGTLEWDRELPEATAPELSGTTLVFCPGLINGLLPVGAFQTAFPEIEREHGWSITRADTHPVSTCEANAQDIRGAIEEGRCYAADNTPIPQRRQRPPKDVFLLCYSKGAPDALALLALHPELAPRIRCVFNWVGAVGGSFLADDMYETIKDLEIPLGPASGPLKTALQLVAPVVRIEGLVRRLDETDVKGAIRDLTTEVRDEFLAEHGEAITALGVPFFNVTAATRPTEVPYFQMQGALELSRSDQDNDMQLTQAQAKFPPPMGTDLAVLRAHHWDVSYDPFPVQARLGSPNLDHRFPRKAAVVACFKLAAELGLID